MTAFSYNVFAKGGPVTGVHFDQLSALMPDIEFSFSIQPSTTPPGARFAKDTEFLAQSIARAQGGKPVGGMDRQQYLRA